MASVSGSAGFGFAGVVVVVDGFGFEGSGVALDVTAKTVTLAGGEALAWDWLSINTGPVMDRETMGPETEASYRAALHAALAEHPLVAGLDMTSVVAGQQQLANQLAYLLPLEPAQKLQLLQLDDPALRLEQLHAMLETLQGDA